MLLNLILYVWLAVFSEIYSEIKVGAVSVKIFRRRKKGYSFADDLVASDTVISLISGSIALVIIITILVISVVTSGKSPDYAGTLLLIAGVLGLNGLFFAITSYKQENGNTNTKRLSVILSIGVLLLLAALYII